ncbi:MAG TPA: amino acid racemase [Myxococcota bacterium]|nr:amino acid racemase [Myxococcota bacterium]
MVAVSAEGAALCYRTICAEGAAALGPHDHPEITLHATPLARYVEHLDAGRWDEIGLLLLASAEKLARAGAELLVCPDNTVHPAIDAIRAASPRPWLHIAEEVADVAAARGLRALGVLGTRTLMEGPVYPARLAAKGIAHRIPDAAARERIDRIIFDELVYGRFEEPARAAFCAVIDGFARSGCDGVVLGCTEIPLLVGPADSALPLLDSTRILARAALREATRA